MPATKTKRASTRASTPKPRCQWCNNVLVQHGPARRKILVCVPCDGVARWPNV